MENERRNTMKNMIYINSNSSKIRRIEDLKDLIIRLFEDLNGSKDYPLSIIHCPLSIVHYSLLILLFLLPLGKVWGQTTVQIGTGTLHNDYNIPWNAYYYNSYTQQLFTSGELSDVGITSGCEIQSISFNYFWSTSTIRPCKLYIGETNVNTLESSFVNLNDLTLVYDNNAATFSSDWNPTISFSSSYIYHGGNLVIAVLMNNQYNNNSGTNFTQYNYNYRFNEHAATKMGRVYYNDNYNITFTSGMPYVNGSAVPGTSWSYRNNIKLTYKPACTTLDAPILTATPVVGGVNLSWSAVSNATSYTVEWGTTSACSNGSQNVTGTSTAISFTSGTRYFRVKANGNGSTYCDSEYSTVQSATPLSSALSLSAGTVACSGSGTTLTATATGFSSPRYSWSASPSEGSGLPSSHTNLTTNTITVTPTEGGNYTYTCEVTENGDGNTYSLGQTVYVNSSTGELAASGMACAVIARTSNMITVFNSESAGGDMYEGATPDLSRDWSDGESNTDYLMGIATNGNTNRVYSFTASRSLGWYLPSFDELQAAYNAANDAGVSFPTAVVNSSPYITSTYVEPADGYRFKTINLQTGAVTQSAGGPYCKAKKFIVSSAQTESITISVPQIPTVTISPTVVTGCGSYEITPTINTHCGEATYEWSRNGTALGIYTENYTATTSGTYTITVTSSSYKQYDKIVQNGIAAIVVVAPTATTDGKAVPLGTDGIGSNASAGDIAYNAAANLQRAIVVNGGEGYTGTRRGFVIPSGGCTATASVEVTIVDMVTPTFNPANYCVGATASFPAISVTNPVDGSELTGSWSPSEISTSSVGTGTYTFNVDDGQCANDGTLSVSVTNCCNISITNIEYSDPTCYGVNDGTMTVTVDGGTAPYTYHWSNGETTTTNSTTAQLADLGAGAYSVTVSDNNGCQSGGVRETTNECFRITDILYNSCDFTAEGYNEMVTLLIGPNDLDADNMNIYWPTSGVSFTGFCENQTIVDGINAYITGGGHVIAPVNGVLPANSEVLIVTSTRFEYTHFDFSGLDHDVYILFQCNNSIETGHFGNSTVSTRNFSISFSSPSCSDAVSYRPPTDENGNAVHYNADGTVEYYNNGCQAPVFFDEITLTAPEAITLSYPSISGYENVEIAQVSPTTSCSGTATYSASGLPDGLSINTLTGVISGTPTAQVSGNISVTISCGGCDVTSNVAYNFGDEPTLDGCVIEEDFSELTAGGNTATNGNNGPSGTELTQNYISDFPTTSKAYAAGGAVKLGSGSAIGYIQTSALDLSVPFYVEFDVKGWSSVEGNIIVTISGGETQTVSYTATLNDNFETKHIDFNAATTSSTVRIATSAKRAFIDNVRVCYPSSCTMTANARQTSGTCEGNIGIVAEATNGTGELSYSWDNGAGTAAQYNNAVSGTTYNVLVTDEAGCTANASVTPVQTGLPVITPSFSPIVCNGGTTSVVLSVSGGTGAPYTYQWEGNTSTTNTISGVSAGTYNVTVRDASCSATSSIIVSEPETITFTVSSTPQVCNTLGTATVSNVNGGNGGYTYAWSNSASDASVNVQSGNYNVTVRDVEGCSATATVSVGSTPTAVSFNAVASNPNCSDGTGSIAVTNIVGTANYTIAWTGGSQEGISADNYTITGLGTGDYIVTVTDVNGCSATKSGLSVEIPAEITYSVSQEEQVCSTPGTITLENVAGGNGGYSYVWHNSAGEVVGTDSNVLSGVNAGVYNLTVSDANDCEVTDAITLGSSSGSVSFTSVAHDLLCYANGSGRIEVQSITGNSPYSVAWSSASANGSQGNITASQFEITNLPEGSYTVVVTDADQCSQMATAVVSQPDTLVATASLLAAIKCYGDTFGVTAGASGGFLETGNEYSYHWNNNVNQQSQSDLSEYGPYRVTVSDNNGCEATASVNAVEPDELHITVEAGTILCNGQTTTVTVTGTGGTGSYNGVGEFHNVSANVNAYTYTITDENNCSASDQIFVTEPDAISVTLSNIVAQTCQTLGSVDVAISGGVGDISYSWDDGNVSTYTSAETVSLTSGPHSISVSDGNDCEYSQSIIIPSGNSMSVAVTSNNRANCNGAATGSFAIEMTNGTSPYSITWNSGALSENTDSHTFRNLYSGNYRVTVSDANGCSATTSVFVDQPETLVASASDAQILCNGGSAVVTISALGGTGQYQNTGTYTLSAGDYEYTVIDANGCQSVVNVHLVNPPALSVTASTVDAQCNGGNGSAHLQISGGTGSYNVVWQDNTTGVDNTHLPVNTNFGYTVTDANGCPMQGTVYVTQPDGLELVLSSEPVSCHGLSDGGVTITTLTGGTQPYTYSWNNASHANSLSGVSAGNYTLTVSDFHGCSIVATASVSQPQTLSARATSTNIVCGVNVGSLSVIASGGTTPYSYAWSNGGQSELQNGVTGGTYSVTVSDANLCTATSSASIVVNGSLAVSINETSSISCFGMSDASLTVDVQNAQQPAIYMWDNGVASTTLNGLSAGSYSVTVSDAWGCVGVASHQINSPSEIIVASQLVEPRCYNSANGTISLQVEGGRPPYSYLWTTGSIGSSLSNVLPGSYGVVISDYAGCTVRRSYVLNAPSMIEIEADVTDASCYGQANGTIEVSADGGVGPYLFGIDGKNSSMIEDGLFENIAAGLYNVVASDANGCTADVQISVSQPEKIQMDVVVTEPTCQDRNDGMIEIFATGGALPYVYALDSNVADSSRFENLSPGMYSVAVTDANGCFIVERGFVVPVNWTKCIEIPNVFTPNGDGVNDEWIIEHIYLFPEAHIYVFNRWGQLMYKGRGNEAPWDGRFRGHFVPAGVYTYIVELDEDMEAYEGVVTVLY